jgi:hypothetical protein
MTVPSFSYSTHDELLARCHSDRSNREGSNTPKLMSSLDYAPDARCTDSETADAAFPGFQRSASAEDPAVLARRHSAWRTRSALFDVPKLMSSLDGYPAVHEGVKDHEFTALPSDAASAAFTPASSSTHDELLARCHSERGNRVAANTPKMMSSFDYDPAASCTDSDMADVNISLRDSFEPIVWEFLDRSA